MRLAADGPLPARLPRVGYVGAFKRHGLDLNASSRNFPQDTQCELFDHIERMRIVSYSFGG